MHFDNILKYFYNLFKLDGDFLIFPEFKVSKNIKKGLGAKQNTRFMDADEIYTRLSMKWSQSNDNIHAKVLLKLC